MLRYVIFKNSETAMRANNLIDLKGVRLIPLPSRFDEGCGLCLKVSENLEEVENILRENKIDYEIQK